MNEESFSRLSLTAKKNKCFELTNSNDCSAQRSVTRRALDRSVSVALFPMLLPRDGNESEGLRQIDQGQI